VDAQGRCDGVGSEEIGSPEPSRSSRIGAREGCLLSDREKQESLHFFGETPERRPWAIKREDRPAAFAGRSKLLSRACRDTTGVYTSEYPIPPLHVTMHSEAGQFDKSGWELP